MRYKVTDSKTANMISFLTALIWFFDDFCFIEPEFHFLVPVGLIFVYEISRDEPKDQLETMSCKP